jgi:hypothetical protein
MSKSFFPVGGIKPQKIREFGVNAIFIPKTNCIGSVLVDGKRVEQFADYGTN